MNAPLPQRSHKGVPGPSRREAWVPPEEVPVPGSAFASCVIKGSGSVVREAVGILYEHGGLISHRAVDGRTCYVVTHKRSGREVAAFMRASQCRAFIDRAVIAPVLPIGWDVEAEIVLAYPGVRGYVHQLTQEIEGRG